MILDVPSRAWPARVVEVIDGDTVKLAVLLAPARGKDKDYGFSVYVEGRHLVLHYSFRLLGCNAAEHGTPGGDAATANLRTLLPVGEMVTVASVKNDKYSRYDAAIMLPDGTELVKKLIAEQWAAPWDGTGPKPVPLWPRTAGAAPA